MHAVVLGSAQDGGLPQPLCRCARCLRARAEPAVRRTASSVALVEGGEAWLLDGSPDLAAQLAALPPEVAVRGVLPTHAHAGHVTGLLRLGKEGPDAALEVHATPSLAAALRASEPYAALWRRRMALREVAPGGALALGGGVRVEALPIRHRAELSDTVAWLAEGPGLRPLYLPDTDAWDAPALAALGRLRAGDVALVDGTFWAPGEVSGRDLAEVPHPFVALALEALAPARDRGVRVLFTHLNHSNPLADAASPERARAEAAGFGVAEDGLRLGGPA